MTAPNILFVMLDDCGKEGWDLYPGHRSRTFARRSLDTPRLTALGTAGRVLDNFWVTPLCLPTRCAFASGALPHRTGHLISSRAGVRAANCATSSAAIFAAMKAAGYEVGAFGKWHLNFGITQCPGLPDGFAIDDYLITIAEGGDRYWGAPVLDKDQAPYTLAAGIFSDDATSDRAAAFLAAAPQPFYCQWWPNLTHRPFTTTPISMNARLSDEIKWLRMVKYVDALVGKLLDALAAAGRTANTLVFVTTDNGGPGPVVGGEKLRLTEDGVCVPTLCYHPDPAVVAPGREARLGQITDLVATFSALAGTPAATPDGVDLRPLLAGTAGTPRAYCASQAYDREWAVRRADGKKIAMPQSCHTKPSTCVPLYFGGRADEERQRGRRRGDLPAAQRAVYDELKAEAQRLGLPGA